MADEQRNEQNGLSEEQGKALLWLARETIAGKLGFAPAEPPPGVALHLKDPALQERRGTFVTLKKHGELRGCIGCLTGMEPIIAGVRRNAVNAAFSDPRFRPLAQEELAALKVEVSILTEAKPLAKTDPQSLLADLRPGKDGVIIRLGGRSATFLPQVWEQLPRVEDFLVHLCRKACLSGDAWQSGGLEVLTYQVQCFEE